MSDRTSAYLFARMFKYLARTPDEPEARKFARELMRESREYDFSNDQMGCDNALIKLGVAAKGIDPDDPDEHERVLYMGEDGFEAALKRGGHV